MAVEVADALSANAPHLDDLRDARVHYIIGVKPGDHAFLFERLRAADEAGQTQTGLGREAIRTPARSVSNTEFHHSGDEVNTIARSVVQTLEDRGIRAMNPAMGFPMEMDRFPGKAWVVSHKPVAVAALVTLDVRVQLAVPIRYMIR